MKPAGLLLLLPAGFVLLCSAEEQAKAKLSDRIRKEVIAKLPAYQPKPANTPLVDSNPVETDGDLLVLPKVVVKEKRLPGNDPDLWLSDKQVQKKAMIAYRTSMTDFEWALNGWYIPYVTPSPSARARGAYESAKVAAERGRLLDVIRAIETIDPKDAAKLRQELTRPANSLPKPEPK